MKLRPVWGAAVVAATALACGLGGVAAEAQEEARAESAIEEVVVVGSRRRDRSAADSPVPVDVIDGDDFMDIGPTDMDWLLSALVPSYNVNQQPISDAATIVRPANLRGLSPDATLVLLNGKRRHRSGVIAFLGGGISDGSQGPDLASIPAIALDRVEVLRDGASAQYGSDAIAGVLNFVLKEDAQGGTLQAKWGQYYEGDGALTSIAANVGLPLGDRGFANLSAEYGGADPTSRSVQRGDALALIAAGNSAVRQPAAQIWGAPEVTGDYKLFGNFGLEVGEASELYAFGNLSQRTVEGGFFFRNPNTRGGIFRGPVLDDGTPALKVADLSADGMSGNCPVVPIVGNVPDATAFNAVRAAPDCWAFNERFPGGFTPQFGADVEDSSFAVGLRGRLASGWFYDVSAVVGTNQAQYFMKNTINPQLAAQREAIPTTYVPGMDTETDQVFDLNLSKPLDLGWHGPLHLALGYEYRQETFEITAGGRNSWIITDSLAAQGFGIGSNGFPGFPPRTAGEWSRASQAAYVDLETQVNDAVLIGAAARYEDYEDFGATLDGKFAARLQVSETFALRGAVSTGFRAPTAGQSNTRKVSTVFVDAQLADQAVLPPTHPISARLGGKPLQPEESVNMTVGAVMDIGRMAVTADYYNIAVEGRVAQSSQIILTEADIAALLADGVTDASSYSSVVFFTNDFDTRTQGIDVVATLPLDLGPGATDIVAAFNWNKTEVEKRNPDLVLAGRVRQLEENVPNTKLALTVNHVQGRLRLLGRMRYYGEYFEDHLDSNLTFPIEADGGVVFDAEAVLAATDNLSLVLGAENILDQYPEGAVGGTTANYCGCALPDEPNPYAHIVGAKYPVTSPWGFNGGFYYLRAVLRY